ncbi:NACHT domain-containing NTPase [Pseudomonas putida]|uniref:NACHT domain-containing protein n=1 Tax=Pseudomonas putida TaxID=303 RepID=UPI002169F099|nr:hypothetical protein [Pseudomonas putida]MCS4065484.1 hypothetical protein [Pseudomonas putida]
MPISYDLTQLDPNSFENMVNYLSMKVLGSGSTGFAPGSDGGRDGYFEGEATYPSERTRWSGVWYIQSKFHKPHLSKDSQKWLISQVQQEISSFQKHSSSRVIPDIWILATNIEPSGVPQTGAFDKIKKLVRDEFGAAVKIDIWGGRKILDLLSVHTDVASHYGHFLTPGNVLTTLYDQLSDANSQIKSIVEHLVVGQFNEQVYTKLEQAGSSSDNRPKLYELFVDLPFLWNDRKGSTDVLGALVASSSSNHKLSVWENEKNRWREWLRFPTRSRVIVLKGGPGQGKSTIGQYFAQIQRAALILAKDGPQVTSSTRTVAEKFKAVAIEQGYWTEVPRIPVTIELKDFAAWYGTRTSGAPKGVLSYLCEKISLKTEQSVLPGTMKRAFGLRSWFINFDGLDEVPNDVKDLVAAEIGKFTDEMLPLIDADVLTLCTTRPQGYSGQFDKLEASEAVLSALPAPVALACASAVVKFDRSPGEAQYSVDVLKSAMQSAQVLELMTTPLQAHIMAVVVRDGGRPPEKRWELFDNFYKVMKKRESQKNFQDARIAKLLREDDTLLKAIHTRLGVVLHVLAEDSRGAETTLNKNEFRQLAYETTSVLIDENVEDVVEALMEATTERLVFVNTPESSSTVRFDVRQLQEFFAGEFIYSEVSAEEMCARMEAICTDSHWREVMHFSLSALVFNGRRTELAVASKVLTAVDGAGSCHKEALLSKRMAVGALLGIRLLNEGVLEQDKRLRQNFTAVLMPLYALPSREVINLLSEDKHLNGQAWLLSAMIDHLFNASESESIGAALALICTLPDDHSRVAEVAELIVNSSNNYLEAICGILSRQHIRRSRAYGGVREEKAPKNWFLIGLQKIINAHELRVGFDYSKAVDVVRGNLFKLAGTGYFQSLTVLETKLIFALMDVEPEQLVVDKNRAGRGLRNYKGIRSNSLDYSWRSKALPDSLNFNFSQDEIVPPVLKLVGSVIEFAKTKSFDNLMLVRNLSAPFGKITRMLDYNLSALLPLSNWQGDSHEQINRLLKLSVASFDDVMKTGQLDGVFIPVESSTLAIEGRFTSASWTNICRDYPLLALDVWMQDIGGHEGEFLQPDFIESVRKIVELRPQVVSSYVLQWGKLFSMLPDNGDSLRTILRATQFERREYYPQTEIYPFKLDMSTELHILPMLAEALVGRISFGESIDSRDYYRNLGPHSNSLLKSFGLNDTILRDIFFDDAMDASLRRAALAIFFAQEFSPLTNYEKLFHELKFDKLIEGLADRDAPIWFIKSVLIFVDNYLSYGDLVVRKLIGEFFYTFRENYGVQLMMQHLLSQWRENSYAPVQSKGLLKPWLSGEA